MGALPWLASKDWASVRARIGTEPVEKLVPGRAGQHVDPGG